MNVLTDGFPDQIKVNNNIYNINSDFKTCLKIVLAFEDEKLTIQEKCGIMLELLYKEDIALEDFESAINQASKFLNCGDEKLGVETNTRLYSFELDAKYIYSAFKTSHSIDLSKVNLHWWLFCYLFFDLDKDCFFSKIIDYRHRWNEGKLSDEERKLCNSIKHILFNNKDDIYGADEIAADFMSRWNGDE